MPLEDKNKVRSKSIDEELTRIRTRLDQLIKQANDAGLSMSRETTEALTTELVSLKILEDEARKIRNSQLIGRITSERDRVRETLGITIKRRR